MDYQFTTVERDGHLTIVTLNRPEVLNALHNRAHKELEDIFNSFDADSDQWIAILTGAGDRAFSTGNDLKTTASEGWGSDEKIETGFGGLTSRFGMNKPVIAAVNGFALGGGFELALACDLIIAAENASFGLPEARVGLAALAGGLIRLPRLIGEKRALGLILTGRRVSAADGFELGFVSEVAPKGKALEVAKQWAREIMEASPMSVRASKEVVRKTDGLPLEEALTRHLSFPAVRALLDSEDAVEGPRAFSEKRPPQWTGR